MTLVMGPGQVRPRDFRTADAHAAIDAQFLMHNFRRF
jgi:hypothetical protein